MSNFVGNKPSPLSILIKGAQKVFGKKQKTTGTEAIKNVPIATNLTTKRNIQDMVVKAVDKGVNEAEVPPSVKASQSTKQSASETKRKKSKELKGLSYRLDKLQEKVEKKAKGGRVGLKRGTGLMQKKSNVQKIKETFGPKKNNPKMNKAKKKFPDLTGDGKVTFADVLKGRGVINGKKKNKRFV